MKNIPHSRLDFLYKAKENDSVFRMKLRFEKDFYF